MVHHLLLHPTLWGDFLLFSYTYSQPSPQNIHHIYLLTYGIFTVYYDRRRGDDKGRERRRAGESCLVLFLSS